MQMLFVTIGVAILLVQVAMASTLAMNPPAISSAPKGKSSVDDLKLRVAQLEEALSEVKQELGESK
jgi:hypothetical protein